MIDFTDDQLKQMTEFVESMTKAEYFTKKEHDLYQVAVKKYQDGIELNDKENDIFDYMWIQLQDNIEARS